jgi:hypothetical protein
MARRREPRRRREDDVLHAFVELDPHWAIHPAATARSYFNGGRSGAFPPRFDVEGYERIVLP